MIPYEADVDFLTYKHCNKMKIQSIFSLLIILAIACTDSTFAQSEFSSATIGIGVVVSDLERSVEFYTDVIGLKKVGGFDVDEDFAKKSGLTGGPPIKVVTLKLEDKPEATQWKLTSFGKKAPDPLPRYLQDIVGMRFITINVTNLKPFLERINKHGVKLLGETPIPLGSSGEMHFVLVSDPDGTLIELIGPMEGE
jgi:catechol 2,3-dioxygenase-like lactoylglutathione lyase family enzyme